MPGQTLTIRGRRFVVLSERDYLKLQERAHKVKASKGRRSEARPEFASEAMRELRSYRKTRKAANWNDVKATLGI